MFSNKIESKFSMTTNQDGVWMQCINAIKKCESGINKILKDSLKGSIIDDVCFSNERTTDFNEDIDVLFGALTSLAFSDKDKEALCTYVSSTINSYIENEMLPLLKSLEILIVFSAFVLEERPIMDLFFTTKNKEKAMRDPHDFGVIMSGDFMTFFYKVLICTYKYMNDTN